MDRDEAHRECRAVFIDCAKTLKRQGLIGAKGTKVELAIWYALDPAPPPAQS